MDVTQPIWLSGSAEKGHYSTVKDNLQLSEPQEPGTSKLDWRYFEHNKVDRNELQICIKTQEQEWPIFFCQIVQFISHFCSCAFMQIDANLELIPISFIIFKVPPVQF